MFQTGSISDWNCDTGSGHLVSEGRRISLYLRDFKEVRKPPAVGDVIRFVEGIDKWGKPCVCRAVQVNAPHRLKVMHFSILLFLVLPGFALYHAFGRNGVGYGAVWVAIVSWLTHGIYATDKHQARNKGEREPESTLHFLELLGGWPGAFFAQRRLRHKSSKGEYLFIFVLIVGFHQFMAIDALRGWPFVKLLLHAWDKLK